MSVNSFPFTVPFVRWADSVPIEAGAIMPLRRIYDHELVYVISGHGHILIDDTAHTAQPDSLFFILPRAWHSFRGDRGETMTLLGIHFDWVPQHDTLLFPIFRAAAEPIEEARFREPRQIPGWDLHKTPCLNLKGRPPREATAGKHRVGSRSRAGG